MDRKRLGERDRAQSWPLTAIGAGLALAALALLLAAIAGEPYLKLSSPSPWIILAAVALFAALFAVPFALNQRLVAADPSRAEAWEGAMLVWGAVALATLALGVLMIWAGGYSPENSLVDAIGLLLVIEAGIVVLVLAAWMLAG